MTPDQDLSARLLPCPFCGMHLEYASPVIYVHPIGKCILSGRNFKKGVIGQWGKRVASADHERAVQAAVAKAVEASVNAENEACAKMLDNEADDYEADASRFRGGTDPHHYRMDLATTARKYAAAIRSRGVAG